MEAAPKDLIEWTGGRAMIATGSPIAPVSYGGRQIPIAQCNNTYVFPAIGLAIVASGASRVTDEMLRAGAHALAEQSPAIQSADAPLLPPLQEIRKVTRHLARAVALEAQRQGHAKKTSEEELEARIAATFWEPGY